MVSKVPSGESLPYKVPAQMQEGLRMDKEMVVKEDGRYIIFYTFAEGGKAEPKSGEERRPCRS